MKTLESYKIEITYEMKHHDNGDGYMSFGYKILNNKGQVMKFDTDLTSRKWAAKAAGEVMKNLLIFGF